MKLIHDELQFDVEDLQDLDDTFSTIICAGLYAFKARIVERGDILIPSKIWAKYVSDYRKLTEEQERDATVEWLSTIDQMIEGFKPESVMTKTDKIEGRCLFAEYFHNLWS